MVGCEGIQHVVGPPPNITSTLSSDFCTLALCLIQWFNSMFPRPMGDRDHTSTDTDLMATSGQEEDVQETPASSLSGDGTARPSVSADSTDSTQGTSSRHAEQPSAGSAHNDISPSTSLPEVRYNCLRL